VAFARFSLKVRPPKYSKVVYDSLFRIGYDDYKV